MIIEKDVLRTDNWSKSKFTGRMNPETFSPYPKNPLLASFFVNIGRADTLGSGMRNLYKYTKLYSHAEPYLSEGDIFEVKIPLSADANIGIKSKPNEANNEANVMPIEANRETYDRNIVDTILSKLIEKITMFLKTFNGCSDGIGAVGYNSLDSVDAEIPVIRKAAKKAEHTTILYGYGSVLDNDIADHGEIILGFVF